MERKEQVVATEEQLIEFVNNESLYKSLTDGERRELRSIIPKVRDTSQLVARIDRLLHNMTHVKFEAKSSTEELERMLDAFISGSAKGVSDDFLWKVQILRVSAMLDAITTGLALKDIVSAVEHRERIGYDMVVKD